MDAVESQSIFEKGTGMPHTITQAAPTSGPLRRARSGFARSSAALAATAAALFALGGCASGTPSAVSNVRYDLGAPTPLTNSMNTPPVKVLNVSAAKDLDSDNFVYRLKYANGQRTGAYSDSHWTMSPADLVTQRLRSALASHGTVLTGSDSVRAPLLQVDLTDFEQVFDSSDQSHGEVSARATLSQHGQVISQRTFIARAPSYTADAAGGARALAAAADDLIAQMAAWLGVQPLVASQ